jgi:hypothetical protein
VAVSLVGALCLRPQTAHRCQDPHPARVTHLASSSWSSHIPAKGGQPRRQNAMMSTHENQPTSSGPLGHVTGGFSF